MNTLFKALFAGSLFAIMAMPALASVVVNSPVNGAQVGSAFTLSATAANCSSQNVAAMGYSLDNSSATTIINNSSINTQVQSSTGTHTLHVKAWGNGGASCVTDVSITVSAVTSAATGEVVIPSNAVSVSSIQTFGSWIGVNDSGGGGASSGSMSMGNSPSLSGNARKFVTNYSNYGDERYYETFGDDTTSTNFLYDVFVYIASPSTGVANLEMDMNQTMPNGQTVLFGVQCDGYSSTWDYTGNKGTPTAPVDEWLHSSAYCNPRGWSTNVWHHVQINYSRDNSGNVTYNAVWLDGLEEPINATVSSAFALGWAPVLLTNFQVDGVGASGTSTVYLDNLTVYRW
jgi:hypothetical protein